MTGVREFGRRAEDRVYAPRPAAYAVILDSNGRVACVRGSSGLFLPGGGARKRETPQETLAREVREECAFELAKIAPLGSAVQFFVSGSGVAYELQATFFRAEFGSAVSSEPELLLQYLSVDDAARQLSHECHRWAVRSAVSRDREEPASAPSR